MILRRDAGIFQELTVVRTPRPPTRLHSIFASHFTLSLIFCSCSARLCNISCRENSSLLYSCSPHFRLADAPRCALLLAGQAAAQAELPTGPTRHTTARQILKVQQPSPPSCAFGFPATSALTLSAVPFGSVWPQHQGSVTSAKVKWHTAPQHLWVWGNAHKPQAAAQGPAPTAGGTAPRSAAPLPASLSPPTAALAAWWPAA